jgi:hypothetical protein
MKKNACLMSMVMFLIWMLLAACAPMQKTVITNSNLSTLKGKWSGWTTFSSYQTNPLMTTLEISNDKVPIEGKIVIDNFPGPVRRTLNIPLKDVSADNSVTLYFQNGKITDNGTILGTNGQNFLELTYYEGEKQKLDGRFYFYGAMGTTEFTR